MGILDHSVYFQALKAFQSTPRLRFNRALITFVPTGGLVAGFTELALAVTQSDWQLKLRARGGVPTDLLWQAVAKFWAPAGAKAGATGVNPAKATSFSDKLILGRRTHAEPTKWTILITGGLDGKYTLGAVGYEGTAVVDAVGQTAAQIRTSLVAAWNLVASLAAVSTAAANGAASLDITTDVDGFPFIPTVLSTGSPMTLTPATEEGDYEADLDAIRLENDPNEIGDFYFIHDLQLDDATNLQGAQWCIAQKAADPRKSYLYVPESYASSIPDGQLTNDPASTLKVLLTPLADENNDRSVAPFYVESIEHAVPTWLGRCIGYKLGTINFAQRELIDVPPVKLADERVAASKTFNFYSPESPLGNTKWGYLGSGRYIDDLWAEDILTFEGQKGLLGLLVSADALDYTDEGGIAQGGSCIKQRLLAYQDAYLVPDSIEVFPGKKSDQSTEDIVENRIFSDYTVRALARGLISRYGSGTRPINLTISI